MWDVATRRQIGKAAPDGSTWENAVAFSPDGRYLVIGTDVGDGGVAGKAWLWDTRTRRLIGPPMTNGGSFLSAVAFSPDGKLIATADKQVRLFSATTQRPVGAPLAVGTGSVNDMVFSPDGSMIAVATNAGVTLWDVASRRQIGSAINVGVGPALTRDIVNRVCAIAGGSMTRQQWSSYVASEPFLATCPTSPSSFTP